MDTKKDFLDGKKKVTKRPLMYWDALSYKEYAMYKISTDANIESCLSFACELLTDIFNTGAKITRCRLMRRDDFGSFYHHATIFTISYLNPTNATYYGWDRVEVGNDLSSYVVTPLGEIVGIRLYVQ
jgi:hypothetical protein